MAERTLPQEATAVFRVRPEDFVATRDVVAADLRGAGRDEDAAAVKALRKPIVVVWALNQLADRAPGEIQALLDAGRELRDAQRAATAARGADRLREAAAARRAAAATLTTVAAEALDGATAAQTDAIRAALETASIDPEAGVHLSTGTFTKPPAQPPGFGDVFGLASVPGGGGDAAGAGPREAAKAAGPDLAGLRKDLERATKTAQNRRAAADRLARKLAEQRNRVSAIEAEHAEAEEEALEADTERKRAERALAKAEKKSG